MKLLRYVTTSLGFLLPSFVRFYFRRTSERAACLIIDAAEYMDAKDCRELADYLRELAKVKDDR